MATLLSFKAASPYAFITFVWCSTITWITLKPFCLRSSRYLIAPPQLGFENNNQPVSPSQKKGLPSADMKKRPLGATFNGLGPAIAEEQTNNNMTGITLNIRLIV